MAKFKIFATVTAYTEIEVETDSVDRIVQNWNGELDSLVDWDSLDFEIEPAFIQDENGKEV